MLGYVKKTIVQHKHDKLNIKYKTIKSYCKANFFSDKNLVYIKKNSMSRNLCYVFCTVKISP